MSVLTKCRLYVICWFYSYVILAAHVAITLRGTYVLFCRKIVINLLLAGGPGAKLKKADIMAAARVGLKRDITTIEYGKVRSGPLLQVYIAPYFKFI